MQPKKEIPLADLFPRASGKEDDLRFDDLDRQAAARIAAHLGLGFIEAVATDQANVCQANSEDVRPEYRTAVSADEIFCYLLAVREEEGSGHRLALPYPSGPAAFWTLMERGRSKRDRMSRSSKGD
jgi:hypothetical protein